MLQHKNAIGKLDYRVTFQQKVIGINESNEDEEVSWVNIETNPTVWASKTDRSGNESYRADKLTDYENTTFVCRYRSDITPKNRVVCGGVPYNILSIQEVSRKRFLSMECESGGEFIGAVVTTILGAFTSGFSNGFT